ncbi:MAG: hypothetical protein Kow0022_07990 [Phycisphaerales bacterium]
MTSDPASILRLPLDELPDPLPIPPIVRRAGQSPVQVAVRPPGSKSLTNRALLLAALAEGTSTVRHPLTGADDAERMLEAIERLGARVDRSDPEAVRISGVGGAWRVLPEGVELFLNNAGTATRFLAASSLLATGPVTIDGNERMRQRPLGELIGALRTLGARVDELGEPGCVPVRITPPPENRPSVSRLAFGRTQSSQFISGLLMTAACLPEGLTIDQGPEPTSGSYVAMTVRLLDQIGVRVRTSEQMRIVRVLPGLRGFDVDIEPDASGATYFWAAGALMPGASVRVAGLDSHCMQGDAAFPDHLARMGAHVRRSDDETDPWVECRGPERLSPTLADMSSMPDAAMTLAVCCAFAGGTSILRGVRTLRVKECDRIQALQTELGRLGVHVACDVHADSDVMTITPPTEHGQVGVSCRADAERVEFDTYDDHRMAMSLALVGLRRPNVWIRNPRCVEKTYPGFWADLAGLYE